MERYLFSNPHQAIFIEFKLLLAGCQQCHVDLTPQSPTFVPLHILSSSVILPSQQLYSLENCISEISLCLSVSILSDFLALASCTCNMADLLPTETTMTLSAENVRDSAG
jgi:hypothetical protein